ncbi:MAG TPA: hypothetical protein VL137_16215 [Polyangiaceae bacterium]|nr:hypothetical protein [Polyangiaceae bacterium]
MKAIKHLVLLSSFGLASILIVSCISSSSGGGGGVHHSTDAGNHSGPDAGSGGANHGAGGSAGNHNVAGAVNAGATGNGTDGGVDGSTPIPTVMGPVGAKCNRDNDCAAGLTCLTANSSDWLGGGIANGYCTASCVANPSICAEFPGTACVGNSTIAFCFETCSRGVSTLGGSKCQDREDVACYQPDPNAGAICQPACGTDAQCPQGRHCDLFGGVCVDTAPAGDPIGAACDPAAATNTCQGFCLGLGPNGGAPGMCSGFCTLGLDYPGCGVDPAQAPAAGAALCWPGDATDAINDTGLCLQRCNVASDCANPNFVCSPFADAQTQQALGAVGFCLPPEADAGTLGDAGIPPGDGG